MWAVSSCQVQFAMTAHDADSLCCYWAVSTISEKGLFECAHSLVTPLESCRQSHPVLQQMGRAKQPAAPVRMQESRVGLQAANTPTCWCKWFPPGIGACSPMPSLCRGVLRAGEASVSPLYPSHSIVLLLYWWHSYLLCLFSPYFIYFPL